MFNKVDKATENCPSCILKYTNYILGVHKCYVFSCKTTNFMCTISYKFSLFKLFCCIFGLISGLFTAYEFVNELFNDEPISLIEIYMKLYMISCGLLTFGNSFLWNLKIKEYEKAEWLLQPTLLSYLDSHQRHIFSNTMHVHILLIELETFLEKLKLMLRHGLPSNKCDMC